eukprot:c28558_g1_i2 orf=108-4457(+)
MSLSVAASSLGVAASAIPHCTGVHLQRSDYLSFGYGGNLYLAGLRFERLFVRKFGCLSGSRGIGRSRRRSGRWKRCFQAFVLCFLDSQEVCGAAGAKQLMAERLSDSLWRSLGKRGDLDEGGGMQVPAVNVLVSNGCTSPHSGPSARALINVGKKNKIQCDFFHVSRSYGRLPGRATSNLISSICGGSKSEALEFVGSVLGRFLLFSLILISSGVAPYGRFSRPACAAPPVRQEVPEREVQDFYDAVSDEGLRQGVGRNKSGGGREWFREQIRTLKSKAMGETNSYEDAKRKYESLRNQLISTGKRMGENVPETNLSRVVQALQSKLNVHTKLHKAERRRNGAASRKAPLSMYAEKIERAFEERFKALAGLEKESRNGEMASLLKQVEEEMRMMLVEGRRLRGKALSDMETALVQLRKEKVLLVSQLEKVADKYLAAEEGLQKIDRGMQDGRGLKEELETAETEFVDLWKGLMNVEAKILQKEVEGFQIVLNEIPNLERKIDTVISKFGKEVPPSLSIESDDKSKKGQLTEEIKELFEKIWEQRTLLQAVDVQEAKLPMDKLTKNLIESVSRDDKYSQVLQNMVDKSIEEVLHILKEMEVENAAKKDIVEGFSADQVQHKSEMDVPKVSILNLSSAWRKWREEKGARLNQFLLNNVEFGHKFLAKKQEQILLARDRVVSRTWYDGENRRWEMSPEAAAYAITKDLVKCARIRHDGAMMYLTLKGDERDYHVNILYFDAVFEEYGGFDAFYAKMVILGVNPTFEVMWIPLKEWDTVHLLSLPFKICYPVVLSIWKSPVLSPIKRWYLRMLSDVAEEVMVRFGFPLLELFPNQVQLALGVKVGENDEITPILEWKIRAEMALRNLYDFRSGSTGWWISLFVRCFILGLPVVLIYRQIVRTLHTILGPAEDMNEVEWKEKKWEELKKEVGSKDKVLLDPVKHVFERMKRIKQPEVSLKDFSGLEAIKEEIKEIVIFLQNPIMFKEMGARPPRGVLITGPPGTGKTSLALAIAAEAKVPMVEIQGAELEGGAWVGQGASNVRELFNTARELAPLIIFIDDFDYFAGIRGKTRHAGSQDHESLINQLLVELDGFETQEGVILMATTSRPETVDEALRRPGRMDRTIVLPMPNWVERESILQVAAEATMDPNLVGLVNWQETLNKFTPKWLKRSRWMRNWKEGLVDWLGLRVTESDVESALERIDYFGEAKPGLDLYSPSFNWTREFKFPHAVWAAGRGLLALLLPNFDLVEQIWLDPTSWDGIGYTKFTKRMEAGYEETGTMTRSYYEKQLVLCFGSYISGCLLLPFGERNNLSRFELKEAERIATSMVLEYGWGPDDGKGVYILGFENPAMSMGEELEYKLNAKVDKLYHSACDRAREMLQKNRKVLEAFLEHLLQHDSISKKDMSKILKENGAIMEEEPFILVPHTNGRLTGLSTNGSHRVPVMSLSGGSTS